SDNELPTLIYFFAPWCQVCHASIDNLEDIYQSEKDNINIYLVALDWKNLEEILDFLSQHQLSMPVLLGTNQTRSEYKIKGYPSYYLIDSDGKIVSKNFGYSTELGLRVRVLLNSQP
ncbi:MAG: TlpA family protein disulfide reductase, partial [Gammaproteobacteria bacterium]|nr:TlpA family protein disulfide reductase [Gammaproteobacteria bacterium]